LGGCADNPTGDWVGVCSFTGTEFAADMEVFANVTSNNGYTLNGQMTISDWTGTTRTGALNGNQSGSYVGLNGFFLSELGLYELELDTQQTGNTMTGPCYFRVPNGTGALIGTAELSR